MSEEITNEAPVENTGNNEPQPEIVQPETLYANKYKSVTELEKGYEHLQSKLGGHIGAPDEYTFNEGVEIDENNPLFTKIQEVGKEYGLNNESLNAMVEMYNSTLAEQQEAHEAKLAEEMAKLGDNGSERIQNIIDWANANLSESEVGLLESFSQDAESVVLLEKFISMSKPQGVAKDHEVATRPSYDQDKLHQMRYAKDEHGNRRMSVDPEYRNKVLALESEYLS